MKYPNSYGFTIDLGLEYMDDHEHPNFEVYVAHKEQVYYSSSLIFDENSGELLHIYDP